MGRLFVVEDEFHAELGARLRSMADAIEHLRGLAEVPWDHEPNRAPCQSWRTCHRNYVVVEYDDADVPWEEIRSTSVLKVSAEGVVWAEGFG